MPVKLEIPKPIMLQEHVIMSLNDYWRGNYDLIKRLPMRSISENIRPEIPLKVVEVILPDWAEHLGVEGRVCVPREIYDAAKSVPEAHIWQNIDWFTTIFLLLECWHERVWELKNGPIHSYSFRLRGWDQRVWEYPWVNLIAIFLREWSARIEGRSANTLFGELPKYQIKLSHDVDALRKTTPIRIKQILFNFFNFFGAICSGNTKAAYKFIKTAKRFLTDNEDWDKFQVLLDIEKEAQVKAIFNFYSSISTKSFKIWLIDPSYKINDPKLPNLLSKILEQGHEIGLHPGYESWNDSRVFAKQKKLLEEKVGFGLTSCRQHWLRFSWSDTWETQQQNGIELDTTLMFNDRPGFRNSSSIVWRPWNQNAGISYTLKASPTILMDSHLYDYQQYTEQDRSLEISNWLDKIAVARGQSFVLWHPHTLSKSYNWMSGFRALVKSIKMLEKVDENQRFYP